MLLPRQRGRDCRRQRDQVRHPGRTAEPAASTTARFPVLAVGARAAGLRAARSTISTGVVFYEDPQLKLSRLWDQVIDYWPRSRRIFAPITCPGLCITRCRSTRRCGRYFGFSGEFEFSEHHRSHAASAFFTSPFERAVVVTLDGVGEYETAAVHLGEGNRLKSCARSISRIRSACFIRCSPSISASRSTRANTRSWGWRSYGRPRYLDKLLGPILKIARGRRLLAQPAVLRFLLDRAALRAGAGRASRHCAARARTSEMREEHQDLAASVQQALEIGDRRHAAAADPRIRHAAISALPAVSRSTAPPMRG